MNIGIRLHDTAEGTLSQRLSFAKAQGFSCAHLAMSKAVQGFAMNDAPRLLTKELAETVRSAFSQANMQCAVLGCYLNLVNRDEEALQKNLDIYHAHLRFGTLIGAQVVGTETPLAKGTAFSEPAWESEEAFQCFMKNLKTVVRWAEEENAVLAIEPVYRDVISTPERAERMLNLIASDHLRIILDAVNLIAPAKVDQADAIIADAIRRLGDKVSVLHLKDYTGINPDGNGLACAACGLGHMRYNELLAFGREKNLPMTLENTMPENAQAAREYLEGIAREA